MHELGDNVLDRVIYRGEGHSSIVVALEAQTKVIRLLKKDGKIMKSSKDHHFTQHPMRSIKFIHLIMKPLTDPYLSFAIDLIHLKSEFINKLSERVESHRPLFRVDKTLLLDDQYALVMDDLCTIPLNLTRQLRSNDLCGPTLSVEIKPKQGFLPIHRLVMKSSTNDQLLTKMKHSCLYGLTQYLKLARGRINQISNYCPINLFSGCPPRMRNALEELIRNPQNNLRVFKDLVLAYGENSQIKLSNVLDSFFELDKTAKSNLRSSNEKRFVEILIQCLLNNTSNKDVELCRDNENSFNNSDNCLQHLHISKCKRCDTCPSSQRSKLNLKPPLTHILPKSCVLSSVLRAQKLDTIGAHEALYMLEWLLDKTDKSIDILEELGKPQMPKGFGSPHQLQHESKQQFYFRKVWEFLVSLTAKDCSIIVTLRRISPGLYESIRNSKPTFRNHLLEERKTGNHYLFNVGIADLDQKLPLKIPRICDNLNLIFQMCGDHFKKES